MTSIQDQIKALQRKESKIALYFALSQHLTNGLLGELPEHEGLIKEVCDELCEFILQKQEQIETGVKPSQPAPIVSLQSQLSGEELNFLRALMVRAGARSENLAPRSETPNLENPAPPKRPMVDPNDPLRFMLAHRHLDGKRVLYESEHGPVGAKVQGLVAPNVLIKTDQGYEIAVPPESLTVITAKGA